MFPFLLLYKEGFLICGMTEASLEKGKEIMQEIQLLKTALSQISRGKLFDIDQGGCGITYSKEAIPFLAEIENELRVWTSRQVFERIKSLEQDFEKL